MTAWVVIESTALEGSELFGVWPTFEDARAQIEDGEKAARASKAAGRYDTNWLYRHPDIEEWDGGTCVSTWRNITGTPVWKNNETKETR